MFVVERGGGYSLFRGHQKEDYFSTSERGKTGGEKVNTLQDGITPLSPQHNTLKTKGMAQIMTLVGGGGGGGTMRQGRQCEA